jgi:hypothetical protein
MSYKIAVASGDGVNIDLSFGAACAFDIYEAEGTTYRLSETRQYVSPGENETDDTGRRDSAAQEKAGCAPESGQCGSCGSSSGCKPGGGCGGGGEASAKVKLISDCRCVICKKIGFPIQKQLEKLAITGFDVDCPVEEALTKITAYLDKIDNHQSLRGIQHS